MKTYKANQSCPQGFYFSLKNLDGHFVGADGEFFEGSRDAVYYKFPNTFLVLMSPIIGGLFVLTFPLVMLASIALIGSYSILRLLWLFLMPRANLLENRWEPSMAYLIRPKKTKKQEAENGESFQISASEFDAQVCRELENDR